MFELNFKIKDSGSIYGVQDSLIPYLIANLVKSDNVFYIAKNLHLQHFVKRMRLILDKSTIYNKNK